MKFDYLALDEEAGELALECTGSEPFGGRNPIGGRPGSPEDTETDTEEEGTCFSDLELIDPPLPNSQQVTWITNYIQTLHDALHEVSYSAFLEYVDLDSFVSYFIISELSMDVDSYTRSAYYYKDQNGVLTAGPLWDYNFCMGTSGLMASDLEPWEGFKFETGWEGASDWWRILGVEPDFRAVARQRWDALRADTLLETHLNQVLDELVEMIGEDAASRDFVRWPVNAVRYNASDEPTWEGQINAIREFLTNRLEWLDQNL